MEKFMKRIRLAAGRANQVVVIGAGMCGLTAARELSDQGINVTVVEKARGPGGRMSTRRTLGARFDHGAQYFTVRNERFESQVDAWLEHGIAKRWDARIGSLERSTIKPTSSKTCRYVGVPGMSAPCRSIAELLKDCRFDWKVKSLERRDGHWHISNFANESIATDVLLLTAPPDQSNQLLSGIATPLDLEQFDMQPCWAAMVVFDRSPMPDWDGIFVNSGPLSWLARQGAKFGRPVVESWVLHASPEWSTRHVNKEPTWVCDRLIEAILQLPGAASAQPIASIAHFWRFALAGNPSSAGALTDTKKRLVLAGDWCHGSRVEGAFLSGLAGAESVMNLVKKSKIQ
jgi:predicted NAD/FAD-dependent oxidoreductase